MICFILLFQWFQGLQIGCGMDYTMEFNWIRNDEKRAQMLKEIQPGTINYSHY